VAGEEGGRKMEILLAEDEEFLHNATLKGLIKMGHIVHPARSGAEALDLLVRFSGITAIVTDLNMLVPSGTNISGIDVLYAAHTQCPNIRIKVLTTDTAKDKLPMTDLEKWGVVLVPKPYRITEILQVLNPNS
jgi:CheY-like chemotaxis protein